MVKLEEREQFSKIIRDIVVKDKISYIDAITEYCELVGLEIELASKLVSPYIVSKIAEEAREQNLLRKVSTLPL